MDRNIQQRLIGVVVLIVFVLLIAPVLLDADGRIPEKITHIPPQPKQPDLSHIESDAPPKPLLEPLSASEEIEYKISAKAEEIEVAPRSDSVSQTLWSVQVASFRDSNKATAFRDRLRSASYEVYVREKILSDGSLFTQVFVGPVNSKFKAHELKTQIKSKIGEQGLVVRYRE